MADPPPSKRLRVAFLGPPASYTHQAALNVFPSSEHSLLPHPTFPSIFAAVQSEAVDRGVVPFENSTNGPVYQTLDLFVDRHGCYPDVRVCGDAFVPVHHCLLGRRKAAGGHDAAPRSPDLGHIKAVYTHPQAWTQCTPFLAAHLAHAERHDASSTSRGAALAAADATGASASISSALAARLYGLDVLAEGIEERAGANTTRFLVLRKLPTAAGPSMPVRALSFAEWVSSAAASSTALSAAIAAPDPAAPPSPPWKTLLSFTIPHEDPGALARALEVFARHGVNLTSINARPSGERPWHYEFFIEFWGAWVPGSEFESVGEIAQALRELGAVASGWKWRGSWETSEEGAGR